jgi:energy-converting hydrogenase Eha subunit G
MFATMYLLFHYVVGFTLGVQAYYEVLFGLSKELEKSRYIIDRVSLGFLCAIAGVVTAVAWPLALPVVVWQYKDLIGDLTDGLRKAGQRLLQYTKT